MKKILLPLALMSALLVSCEKPVQEHYYIYSEAFELHFTLYGEEQSVYVESSHDWELTDYPDWCIPSIKSGQDGAQVIFTVTENDSDFQREGEIIFSCGDATFSIRVLQDGLNDNIKFNHVKNELCDEYRVEINGQKVIIDIDRDNDGEISYKEAGKDSGVRFLLDHLKIAREHLAAFGDGDNDSGMLQLAGIGVAVANAVPGCLAAADRITGSNDEDGVAAELERILAEF